MTTRGRTRRRSGFTLIELMVATTVTLLMIAALSQAFAIVAQTISTNRAALEMSGQLRGVAVRLQTDLDQLTAPLEPWLESSASLGYFEYIEGPGNDWDANNDGSLENRFLIYGEPFQGAPRREIDADEYGDSALGDIDDVLMFTVRSSGEPFVGQVLGPLNRITNVLEYDPASEPRFETIASDTAEIIWWTRYTDLNDNQARDAGEPFVVYRRVLLVRPDIALNSYLSDPTIPEMRDVFFLSANDLSVRTVRDQDSRLVRVTNSLSDLTLRENRFAHNGLLDPNIQTPSQFPYAVSSAMLIPKVNVFQGSRLIRYAAGEDVMLTNALAFDVKAFDPLAQVRVYPNPNNTNQNQDAPVQRLLPGAPGYFSPNAPQNTAPANFGGYVDLGYRIHPGYVSISNDANAGLVGSSHFSGPLLNAPNLHFDIRQPMPYDTWPLDYERDGLDQDNSGFADQGTDGFDTPVLDPATQQQVRRNGVDDLDERETRPPYNHPLRGIQVRIRVIDPDSRQVRQMTVAADFTPE